VGVTEIASGAAAGGADGGAAPAPGLAIDAAAYARIAAHAREGYPHEVVGILAGAAGGPTSAAVPGGPVTRAEPLINERGDTVNRYRVDGWTLARRERALEREGFAILGYYHSHPGHPARPSGEDLAHALPNMSYLIVTVRGGEPAEARSWRLREDRSGFDEEPVAIG
jgi:proteasome lid subunit RPN8/RPN11